MKKPCFILLLLLVARLFGQTPSNELVQKGLNAFYQAEFEQAQRIMKTALIDKTLSLSDRFDAHLYSAFSLIRQVGHPDSIRSHFVKAVSIDPSRELNTNLIPPDLYEQYVFVRQATMGGMLIDCKPAQVIAICYDSRTGKSVSMSTPASFINLVAGEYQVVLSAPGYRDLQTRIQVHAGRTDSVSFQLSRLSRPWYKTWWVWGGGGTCALLAWFVFHGKESEEARTDSDLPIPPQRP
jgi:hypothetical protein